MKPLQGIPPGGGLQRKLGDGKRIKTVDSPFDSGRMSRKHPRFRDGEINLEEADRPDFESFRIAVLGSVRANLRIHLNWRLFKGFSTLELDL
jgi:hypothetical protein